MQKAADWTFSLAVPLHMQITTNALVTDYVPTRFRGEHATKSKAQQLLQTGMQSTRRRHY